MGEHARLEREGDLGVLVIDSQPLNLFDAEMVGDILAALDQTGGCRALLVRAEGKYFTGGVDVNVFKGLSQAEAEQLTADLLAITHRIEGLPFPTLASAGGQAEPLHRSNCRSPGRRSRRGRGHCRDRRAAVRDHGPPAGG